MKTVTKTKDLKALMQTPIGGAVASPTPKPAAAKVATKPVAKTKGPTLYFFQQTPAGRVLRAYFVGYITTQTGKLTVGKVFRLWPAANVRGHLDTGKLKRAEGGYALTAPGYNYFTDPEQEADKDLLAKMLKAVKSGKTPEGLKLGAMSPVAK